MFAALATAAAGASGCGGGGGGSSSDASMADDGSADCLFERLRVLQLRTADSAEAARSLTARISSRLTSHDKNIRQSTLERLWMKNSGALQTLVTILENTRDVTTSAHVVSILRETICMKQGKAAGDSSSNKKRIQTKKENKDRLALVRKANNQSRQSAAQQLVNLNATQIIIRFVLQTHGKRDGHLTTESMLQDLIWVLAALSQKDPKFPLKLRMLGCVRTMHLILKTHFTDNKVVFPLLVITKQLSKNSTATSILIRDGVVATYERILGSLGFIPTARLRLCLDAVDYFSRNKVCCMQIVKSGVCQQVLRVFDRWDRYEGRMRLKICAHILQTLQHLCCIKMGRRALCTKKHVQILHRFCAQCPDEPEFDKLLARVCSVITLCLKHQSLPVSPISPATFNLNPILKGTNTSWPLPDEDDCDTQHSECKASSDDEAQDDFDLEDELNFSYGEFEDIELNTDKPVDVEKMYSNSADSFNSSLWINPNDRDIEDLKRYNIFFKEFGPYNRQVRLVKSRSNSRGSIIDEFLGSQANRLSVCTGSSFQNFSPRQSLNQKNEFTVLTEKKTSSHHHKMAEAKVQPSNSLSSLKIHKDISQFSTFAATYSVIATRVRSVIPFVKVAYPDMMGGSALGLPEPLNKMERSACRSKLLSCVERAINPDSCMNDVIYDLDTLCNVHLSSNGFNYLSNSDEHDMMSKNFNHTKLQFESRFESGNLRKAIQIGPREYELVLMPDVNSNRRHQWFYFEVRGMQAGRPYIFNIVNCEKSDSQFNFGMKPVLYSVKEATLGRPGWVRAGSDICYYRNSYHYTQQKSNKCYLTVTFTISFPHAGDVCYLAYHFPFTYSMLLTKIWKSSQNLPPGAYFRAEPLCHSLNNNEVPLLTISAEDSTDNPLSEREVVFLTARVHPGESNASWVMDGTLACLLADSDAAAALRSKYIFKIVPMLNVEGVLNGCHRCGLTNEDLNRRWCKPSAVLHPSIYHAKGLIEYLVRVWRRPPIVYCDYHGHSRKKNVFFYGCAAGESWCGSDRIQPDQPIKYLMLPALMHRISPAFALGSCSFRVERERESTARVTVWRHLGVTRSYTMEASFCGFDRGPFKGLHLNTQHLQSVGKDFCEALNGLNDNTSVDIQITKDIKGEILDISMTTLESLDKDSGLAGDSEAGSASDNALRSDSDEDFD